MVESLVLGVVPLWVIGLCGLLGVLVDFDHFVGVRRFGRGNGRWLHKPILYGCCCVLCGVFAYLGGLFLALVLGG